MVWEVMTRAVCLPALLSKISLLLAFSSTVGYFCHGQLFRGSTALFAKTISASAALWSALLRIHRVRPLDPHPLISSMVASCSHPSPGAVCISDGFGVWCLCAEGHGWGPQCLSIMNRHLLVTVEIDFPCSEIAFLSKSIVYPHTGHSQKTCSLPWTSQDLCPLPPSDLELRVKS